MPKLSGTVTDMPKCLPAVLCMSTLWLSCWPFAASIAQDQPLEQASAHESVLPNPAGCLAAWPTKQTLTGRLMGIVLGAVPEENPPIPAMAILYLSLERPIAVCAAPQMSYPAYEDVIRIKIENLSPSAFQYAMHTWGSRDIRITSTLNTAQTVGQEPGPVIFDTSDFRFCWKPLFNAKRNTIHPEEDDHSGWTCLNSDKWIAVLRTRTL